jgi:DNA-binding NtrC family response regulator
MALKILIVDDEEPARQGLTALLARWGYDVDEAGDGQEALAKAAAGLPSVVLSDLVMPKMDGLELLRALKTDVPFASVILLTGQGSIDTAVTAMKEGAYDYLTKPVDVARLRLLIPKAAERGEALREVALLRRKLSQVWGMGRLVGTSAGMQEVYRLIEVAAPDLSPRAKGPFVAVNCAAIPETLLESEIFGHEKGAFTGALERRPGCFELAHEGTIFLDEIAEMNPGTQAKFLRILQDGTVRRLGGRTEIKVDVRVLAATNKDPVKAIQEGSFREDLYYRLNVVSLALPPLRDRRDDIPALVEAFIEEFNARYDKHIRSLDESVLSGLLAHSWPGNVRELRNTLERAIIVCDGDIILPKHIPPSPSLRAVESGDGPDSVSFRVGTSLEDAEKALILKTLAANGNNKTRAADVLGISLKTLHNKLKTYGT